MVDKIPFYIVAILIIVIGFAHDLLRKRFERKLTFGLIVLSLSVLATFRSIGVGSDDEAYQRILSMVPSLTECAGILCGYEYSVFNIEYGFYILVALISVVSSNVRLLFGATAFLSVYLNLYSIRYFTPHLTAGVLIYFSHFFLAEEMNAIRAGLATAISFYATTWLWRRRYLVFMFLVFLAASVQISSALIVLPALLVFFSPGPRVLGGAGVASLVLGEVFDPLALTDNLVGYGFVENKLRLYAAASEYNYQIPFADIVNLKNIAIVTLGIFLWKRLKNNYHNFPFVFYFFYSAALFRLLFGDFAIVAGRGYSTMAMFEYAVLPMILVNIAGRWLGCGMAVVYALLVLSLNMYYNTEWRGGALYFDDYGFF